MKDQAVKTPKNEKSALNWKMLTNNDQMLILFLSHFFWCLYRLVFHLETFGVSLIIIWWPFQLRREIWIQVLVIITAVNEGSYGERWYRDDTYGLSWLLGCQLLKGYFASFGQRAFNFARFYSIIAHTFQRAFRTHIAHVQVCARVCVCEFNIATHSLDLKVS